MRNCPNTIREFKESNENKYKESNETECRESEKGDLSNEDGLETKSYTPMCSRCGRNNHPIKSCFAKTHINGSRLTDFSPFYFKERNKIK